MARPRTFDEQKVVAAARDLFWRNGFANTSITDLEQATGLKRTSLYAAFGDKEGIYRRALADYQQMSRVEIDRSFNCELSPVNQIRKLLMDAACSGYNDKDQKGCFIVNATSERYNNCPYTTNVINTNRESLNQQFAAKVSEAQESGEIAKDRDVDLLANYLFTFFSGMMITVKSGAPKRKVMASIELCLETLKG